MAQLSITNQEIPVTEITNFESWVINTLTWYGLPSDQILVWIKERIAVFNNLWTVIPLIWETDRKESIYISKFIAAVSSWLFDAALNYLRDETVIQIRKRVSHYDLTYFYDNAVNWSKRWDFKTDEDLSKLSDFDLITWAKAIWLLSDIWYHHMVYINYMRNHASAAHPNQNEITWIQLVSWLETCIKQVITIPLSNITVKIWEFLRNIKLISMSEDSLKSVARFSTELNQNQINNFIQWLFGIYTDLESSPIALKNINFLAPLIRPRISEDIRQLFWRRHAQFLVAWNSEKRDVARRFLQIVEWESYISEDIRIPEIETMLSNLLDAHRWFNNFYNEPPIARKLHALIGNESIPNSIKKHYVDVLVDVFITNWSWISQNANEIYIELLWLLDNEAAIHAVLSFVNDHISAKFHSSLSKRKFYEMIEIVEWSITQSWILEIIQEIKDERFLLINWKNTTAFKAKIESLIEVI